MKIRFYRLTDKKYVEALLPMELPLIWPKSKFTHWLDIEEATPGELERLLAPLDLHPLVVEDCLAPDRSSLLDRYERALYLEFPTNETGDQILRPYFSIVCLPDKLITIRRGMVPGLTRAAVKLSRDIRLYAAHKEALLYHILDYFIDRNILFIVRARGEIDRLIDAFDKEPDSLEVEDILDLKRHVSRLASIAEDHLYTVTALQTVESKAFHIGKQREYFRDLVSTAGHAIRFTNRLEARLRELHESYQLTLHDRSENRLRVLTIISAIFLPLTLMSSIYGMNFQYMPELSRLYAYPTVLAVMIMIALLMVAFFYRRGWFE